jgi:plastocyanin
MKGLNTVPCMRIFWALVTLAMLGFSLSVQAQQNWHAKVGAETPGMGGQALAFLPNELWIHSGDSVTWTFNSDEIHTVSFLVVGQTFPSFAMGCPNPPGPPFFVGSASFDGSTCVTTPPSVKGNPTFTVTFPTSGNYKVQCLVHNTMNGVVHVLDPSVALPHNQAFYDQEAADEERNLLTDKDHATSSGMDGMSMGHASASVSIRVLAANNRLTAGSKKLSASSGDSVSANAHVTAGVGEIASTPGGLQTDSLVRFVKGKITIHVGDTVEWNNSDPEEPHTITFGSEPQGDPFPPSSNVTVDPDGGLRATLSSPGESVHSGFIEQALDDQPGKPVNIDPDNAIGAPFNPTHFRVTFMGPGTYNYKCVLHDNLGMVGQVVVLP